MRMIGPSEVAAVTWASDGSCRGLVLRREHGRMRVIRHWQSVAAEDESAGQELRRGLTAMGVSGSDVLVAGCADVSAGYADVEFPLLAERELVSSLQYELAYHAPIQQERLVWGYRVLASRDSKQSLRLFYLREADWHRWLDELGSLGRGVDAVMPPHACLDPVLSGQTCFLPAGESGGYILDPTPAGTRRIQGVSAAPDEGVGAADRPLQAIAEFDPGPLGELDNETQRSFIPAILLGLYGLSPSLHQDRKTRIAVPYDLRPVRNRYSRMLATFLVSLLLLFGLFAAWREYVAAAGYQQALEQRIQQIEEAAEELQTQSGQQQEFEALAEELQDLPTTPVSFGAALVELTQITPNSLWVQSINWQEGRLDVQFATPQQEENIRGIVENSELFSSVSPQGVRVDRDGTKTIRLRMYATLPGEDAMDGQEGMEGDASPEPAAPPSPPAAPPSPGAPSENQEPN